MSTFYDKAAATALRLLAKFGSPVVLSREIGGGINPITGETSYPIDASVTTTGLLSDFNESEFDGKRIFSGDRKLILSSEHEPLASDTPVIGGEKWVISNIKTVKPDGVTPVVYFVQVRR